MADKTRRNKGRFPQGKFNKDDEGEVALAVGHQRGKVIIEYESPVVWTAMPPANAFRLAQALINHARAAARESGDGEPFTIEL